MLSLTELLKKSKNTIENGGRQFSRDEKVKCPACGKEEYRNTIKENNMVCPFCEHHYKISARTRIRQVFDKDSFHELFDNIESADPLEFKGYKRRIEKARISSGEKEGVVCGTASLNKVKCAVFVMEPGFMMGSMGSALGEKVCRLFEYACENHLPVIGFTASGGARMQEGILSLMQMAKVSGAVKKHSNAGGLYICVLTNPTTGGVTASFAMLGDIIIAEPNAVVGFAGRRVIESTMKKSLPDDFQKSEFVLEHGFIDKIVDRRELSMTLGRILNLHREVI
ncbi:MAG: acetyl-CoA carboxylase carboxyltransferase subunit beta [Firmicutes bacterium]|nr:acetyl-CoA carboxylase carboxyltransferase subunit beta [Bacillota bacterium]